MKTALRSLAVVLSIALVPAQAFAATGSTYSRWGVHAGGFTSGVPQVQSTAGGQDVYRYRGSDSQWVAPALPGEMVVGVESGGTSAELVAQLAGAGYSVKQVLKSGKAVVVHLPAGEVSKSTAAKLSALPDASFAEPNNLLSLAALPNDARYARQWGLEVVGAPAAWDVSTGEGVTIAVIDSGVNASHADLIGRVDTLNDYDFANDDTNAADDNGHGTMVAGIAAAAKDNGSYGAGVAPSATILPVKVTSSAGSASDASVAEGIYWAVDNGADVVNLSLAGPDGPMMADAVSYALEHGVVVVAAAGNRAWGALEYPAAYPGVIAVGATGREGSLAPFSNYGPELDIVAPGVSIMSTSLDGSVGWGDGTSEAAPFVAGAAALLRSQYPTATSLEVAAALSSSATDVGALGWDARTGAGLLSLNLSASADFTGDDAWESDDSTATAPVLERDRVADHAFLPAGETDWIAFDAVAGVSYGVETLGLWGGGVSGADTKIELYSPAGVLMKSNDNRAAGDASSYLNFACTTSGRYFVAVRDHLTRGGGYGVVVKTEMADPWQLGAGDDTLVKAVDHEVGRYHHHTFYPTGDGYDNVAFNVEAGKTYEFVTWDLEPSQYVDTQAWLFESYYGGGFNPNWVVQDVLPYDPITNPDPDPRENSTDDIDGNTGVRIVYTSPRTQRVCLQVRNTPGKNGSHFAVGAFETTPRSSISRVAGADRYTTAEAIAQRAFPGYAGVTDVIVASGEDRAQADAISAAPLAGVLRAPILLTRATSVPAATSRAIQQIAAANGGSVNVRVVGGTGSVPSGVLAALDAVNGPGVVERLGGSDRYSLSALVASRVASELAKRGEKAPAVIIAAGDNSAAFYDALAISPAAYASTVPILLVKKDSVPSATSSRLSSTFASQKRYVANGTAYVGSGVYTSVKASARASTALNGWDPSYAGSGTNRLRMAECIDAFTLQRHWRTGEHIGMASKIPDALTGSVLLGEHSGGLVYSTTSNMDIDTFIYAINLYGLDYSARQGWVLGGTGSVPSAAVTNFDYSLNLLYWP